MAVAWAYRTCAAAADPLCAGSVAGMPPVSALLLLERNLGSEPRVQRDVNTWEAPSERFSVCFLSRAWF